MTIISNSGIFVSFPNLFFSFYMVLYLVYWVFNSLLYVSNHFKHTYSPWWASQGALMVKNPPANAGDMRCGFNPWVRKIPWRRQWQPTPIFLPGEFHGRGIWRATVHGLGAKRVGHNLVTKQQQQQQQNSSQSKTRFVFKACLLA